MPPVFLPKSYSLFVTHYGEDVFSSAQHPQVSSSLLYQNWMSRDGFDPMAVNHCISKLLTFPFQGVFHTVNELCFSRKENFKMETEVKASVFTQYSLRQPGLSEAHLSLQYHHLLHMACHRQSCNRNSFLLKEMQDQVRGRLRSFAFLPWKQGVSLLIRRLEKQERKLRKDDFSQLNLTTFVLREYAQLWMSNRKYVYYNRGAPINCSF